MERTQHISLLGRLALLVCLATAAHGLSLKRQELEGAGKTGGSLFSPADYFEVSTPLTDRVAINAYGFYLGNMKAEIALAEASVRVSKAISVTSSYLYIAVPTVGLSQLTGETQSSGYHEHQFRQAASFATSWRNFNISDRNMYALRLIGTGNINRYRNRIYISRSVSAGPFRFTPFVFDEVYHDFASGRWLRRNWIVGGADLPANRYMTFQLSDIRQDDSSLRSVNFLGLAIILRSGTLFDRK